MKQVKKSSPSKNFYLSIYRLIKGDVTPHKIAKILGMTKQNVYYYTKKLREGGLIRRNPKTRVWEVLKSFDENQVKKSSEVAPTQLPSDSVRGHGFVFVLNIPKDFRNWLRREEFFIRKGIRFDSLGIGGFKRGQKIKINGRKVHVFDKSIVIYDKSSYYSETAVKSSRIAFYSILELVRALERLFKADFKIKGKYQIRVARQHYSLIKNALAGQFYREGKKLEVYTEKGLWLMIDNSLNLHELETLHPKTSPSDNEKVQKLFNNIKETPYEVIKDFKPQAMFNAIGQNAENLGNYAKYLKAHVESVKELALNSKKQSAILNKVLELIENRNI